MFNGINRQWVIARGVPSPFSPLLKYCQIKMESRSVAEKAEDRQVEEIHNETGSLDSVDSDAEFGGPEERARMEKRLLWKLDCRMSIMVVIYILNYVSRKLDTSTIPDLSVQIDRNNAACVIPSRQVSKLNVLPSQCCSPSRF